MHLAIQALSLASFQACHWNKGNKYSLWFLMQFSNRPLASQSTCESIFFPILTMMFVGLLQLTVRSRWQAHHLPSIVMTRERALVPAPVWRAVHSGKGRRSPSRERTLILLAQTQDHDQALWVQWIHLTSCRRAEENSKRFLLFSFASLSRIENISTLSNIMEADDTTNGWGSGSRQQSSLLTKLNTGCKPEGIRKMINNDSCNKDK